MSETDLAAWAQRQAALLRGHARGASLAEVPDWVGIAEQLDHIDRNERRRMLWSRQAC